MADAYICDFVRTPIGRYGGALKDVRTDDLAAYPMRVYRGKLPPLLFGVMIVETEIDGAGQITNVNIVRKPAAAEVAMHVQLQAVIGACRAPPVAAMLR